jgi:diguanylate cyclase (GGDEF)-like protein/PAS domain S-box-containing protein
MTEPEADKDRLIPLQENAEGSPTDRTNVLFDLARLTRQIEIIRGYTSDESEVVRSLGNRALDQIAQGLHGVQDLAGTSIMEPSIADANELPTSLEDLEKFHEEMMLFELSENIKEGPHEGAIVTDAAGRMTITTRAVEILMGKDRKDLKGMQLYEIIHPDDRGRLMQYIVDYTDSEITPVEIRLLTEDDSEKWIRFSAYENSSVSDDDPLSLKAFILDITEAMNLRSKDDLTGVRSRHYIEQEIDKLKVSRSDSPDYPASIIYGDVDDFKNTNDIYGHDEGDALLKVLGGILQESTRPQDCVARMGGDEFMILLRGTSVSAAKRKVKLLEEKLDKRNTDLRPGETPITVSFGVATTMSNQTVDKARKRADKNMYGAKNKKKSIEAEVDKP